jgi:hypothetical protein
MPEQATHVEPCSVSTVDLRLRDVVDVEPADDPRHTYSTQRAGLWPAVADGTRLRSRVEPVATRRSAQWHALVGLLTLRDAESAL